MEPSIWSRNAKPDAWHFIVAVYFALGFLVARFFLDKFIFRRLVIWLLSNGSAPLKMDEATQAKIVKCSESMWKLAYYATVETCVLKITYYEPWFRDTKGYFRDWPDQELKLPLSLFYMCQCGFYIYSTAALLTWETQRKDFSVMMSHHVITVILIGYSYITRELAATVCFGLFAISLLLLRLIFFPFWVLKSSSYDVRDFLNLSESYPTSLYYVFNIMLLMLLVFHVYWWVLICSMIMRQLKNRGKVGEDIRSDSEDDMIRWKIS